MQSDDRPALERLAAYILRPSFAASRLHYDPEQGRIEYRPAKGLRRTLDAPDWIALVTSHIPDPEDNHDFKGKGLHLNKLQRVNN